MLLRIFLLALLACASLYSKEADPDKVVISDLRAIVLVPCRDRLLKSTQLEEIEGIAAIDLPLPASCYALEKRLIPFLHQPLTLECLRQIKNTIVNYYTDAYHPLIHIQVPTQEITSGVLQLVVVESLLGEVKVEGNQKWSSLPRVKKAIQLEPGAPIDNQILMADLNFLNRNPYRRIEGVFEPGRCENTTDLLVLVEDGPKSYQFYVGAANSGIRTTKKQLYFAGFNLFNCFYLGHLLSYQYTTSNFHALQAHTVQYMAPLPNRHILNLYGGYTTFYPKIGFPVKKSHGYGAQTSVRYVIPLLPTTSLKSEVAAGFDFKATNTDVGFSSDFAAVEFHQNVNLTQWMGSYSGFFQQPTYSLRYLFEVFFSPFEWLPDQSDADFAALRPGAENRWIYGRGSLFYSKNLAHSCYLTLSARGQLSSTSLLPSEQFGLGGYDTVRGYDERIVNQDQAILLSAELRSPSWSLVKYLRGKPTLSDSFQLLAFIDGSYGSNHTAVPGEKKSEFLVGIGPGARYTLENYLTCRIDWGIKLHRNSQIGESLGFVHFSVIASY